MWAAKNAPWAIKNTQTNQIVAKFPELGYRSLEQWVVDYAEHQPDVDFALYLCDDIIDCGPVYIYFQKLIRTGRRRAHEARILEEMEDQLHEQPTREFFQIRLAPDGGETDNGPV